MILLGWCVFAVVSVSVTKAICDATLIAERALECIATGNRPIVREREEI